MSSEPDIFDDPRLTAYVLGELEGDDLAALEREVARSPGLAAEVEALRRSAAIVSLALAAEPLPKIRLTRVQRNQIADAGESAASPRTLIDNHQGRRWSALGPATIVLTAAVMIVIQATPMVPQTPLIANNYRASTGVSDWSFQDDHVRFRQLAEPAEVNGSLSKAPGGFGAEAEVLGRESAGGSRPIRLSADGPEARPMETLGDLTKTAEDARGLDRSDAERRAEESREPLNAGLRRKATVRTPTMSFSVPEPSQLHLGVTLDDKPVEESKTPMQSKETLQQFDVNSDRPEQIVEQQQESEVPLGKALGAQRFFKEQSRQVDGDMDGVTFQEQAPRQTWEDHGQGATRDFTRWDRSNMEFDAYGLDLAAPILLPMVPQSDFVEITPLPASVALKRAECDGRYADLIGKVSAPADVLKYGRFHNAGSTESTSLGRASLPSGYRVYVAPDWYIWAQERRSKDEGERRKDESPDE